MWRAYLIAILGSCVIWTLENPALEGWRARSLFGMGVILWIFSIAEACIAVLLAAREALEAQVFIKPPEPTTERYMLQVDAARYIYADIPTHDMEKLAHGLLQGRPFSEREWRGKINNFREVQDEFERRDLVKLEGKKRVLNSRGRRAMLEIAYGHATPSPSPALSLKPMRDG